MTGAGKTAAVGPTFSAQWYRVARLHPRLHSHVRLLRHCYRGEVWHVLDDPVGGRQHRINPAAWSLVARLDGRASLQQIWDAVVLELGGRAPTQPEVLALLGQLHAGELIASEATPDLNGMFEQHHARRRRQQRARRNPLALRVALGNPTRWLDRVPWLARALFSPAGALAWALAVAAALVAAAGQAGVLAAYAAQHLGTPRQWLALWLVYPLIKAVHEAAHALAVRRWGGEVGEVGITLMLLMPVPYVDASAASAFRERHRRVVVSLAGMAAEAFVAAAALALWLVAADGLVREVAFAALLIGGVSTFAFNGNPLVRLDAYHALSDWIESPGLAPRSRAWWLYLARRWLLGMKTARPPAAAPGERRWLVSYGAASVVYQWLLAVAIVGWLLGVQPLLGLLALAWFVVAMGWLPARRLWRWVRTSAELSGRRARTLAVGAVVAALPLLLLLALPLPDHTRADGIVWLPEQALARAGGAGFVVQVLVRDGAPVAAGTAVLRLHDPLLPAEEDALLARERRLDGALQQARFEQPALAHALAGQLAQVRAERRRLAERSAALTVRAPRDGRVALPHADDLPGRFVERGEVVAQVLPPQGSPVRVVVGEDDVARLQPGSSTVQVRLAGDPARTLPARWLADTPAAGRTLPSPLLAERHGGAFALDPTDPRGERTRDPVFTIDLALPDGAARQPGMRAWVRFDHGAEPLAWQWLRRVRQLFVGRFVAPAGAPAPAARPAGMTAATAAMTMPATLSAATAAPVARDVATAPATLAVAALR